MGNGETNSKTFLGQKAAMLMDSFSTVSSYCAWLVIWCFMSYLLLSSGIILIPWGLENVEAREPSLALGLYSLTVWGWALMGFGGIGVYIKASSNIQQTSP